MDIEVVLSKLDNFPHIDAEVLKLPIQDSRNVFPLGVVQVDIEITPDSGGGRHLLTLFQRQMF